MAETPGECQSFYCGLPVVFGILNTTEMDDKRALIDTSAEIREVVHSGDYVRMTVKSTKIAAGSRPGQFVMIRVTDHPFPLLRRPLGIHDAEDGTLSLLFEQVGAGTILLGRKQPGETLDLLGPLGKGFSWEKPLKGQAAALVGGGRGIAPLYFLNRRLQERGVRVHIFYGGKTDHDLPVLEILETCGAKVHWSTDDGSSGWKGFVSDLCARELDDIRPEYIFTCGPDQMMRKVAETAAAHKIPCECSLESVMGCGFGVCWGCVRKVSRGNENKWIKICDEGPVFPSEEIVWDE